MTTPELLNLIGRLGVAFYFLWSVWFNYQSRAFHVSEFDRIGVPQGSLLTHLGILWTLIGTILLLVPGYVVVGAAMIIIFTAAADALFHRYWTYEDPHEATIHKFFLFEHVALIGGLIGLAAPHL